MSVTADMRSLVRRVDARTRRAYIRCDGPWWETLRRCELAQAPLAFVGGWPDVPSPSATIDPGGGAPLRSYLSQGSADPPTPGRLARTYIVHSLRADSERRHPKYLQLGSSGAPILPAPQFSDPARVVPGRYVTVDLRSAYFAIFGVAGMDLRYDRSWEGSSQGQIAWCDYLPLVADPDARFWHKHIHSDFASSETRCLRFGEPDIYAYTAGLHNPDLLAWTMDTLHHLALAAVHDFRAVSVRVDSVTLPVADGFRWCRWLHDPWRLHGHMGAPGDQTALPAGSARSNLVEVDAPILALRRKFLRFGLTSRQDRL